MAELPAGYPNEALPALEVLKSHEVLSVEDLKVLAMIETWGEVFYQVLSRAVPDETSRDLLLRNGAEERGHAHRLLKAIKLKGGSFELPPNEENPFNPFALDNLPANSELLGMIQQAEIDGDTMYQTWADAEPNEEVAQLLRLNGREETRHFERVSEVKRLNGIA